jgi:hypothetical protein
MEIAAGIAAAQLGLTKEVTILLPSLVEEENVQAVVYRVTTLVPIADALQPLHALHFRKSLLPISGTSKLPSIPLDCV